VGIGLELLEDGATEGEGGDREGKDEQAEDERHVGVFEDEALWWTGMLALEALLRGMTYHGTIHTTSWFAAAFFFAQFIFTVGLLAVVLSQNLSRLSSFGGCDSATGFWRCKGDPSRAVFKERSGDYGSFAVLEMVEFAAGCRGSTKAWDVNWEEFGGRVTFGIGFRKDGISIVPFHGAYIGGDGANGDLACHRSCRAEIGGLVTCGPAEA
jgi:hypothetical protein